MSRHRRPAALPLLARSVTLFVIWFTAAILSLAGVATLTPSWRTDQTVAVIDPCGATTGRMRFCDAAELDTSRVTWVGGRDAALGS